VRDYIHVVDLAEAHIRALEKIDGYGVGVFNIGTGRGYSVLEMIKAFEKASGREVKYRFAPRREGDVAAYYADCGKAERELGFKAQRTLSDMCEDLWRYVSSN
jgi:UDP-glucose 4-epimerase